jgi:hypothetical protein
MLSLMSYCNRICPIVVIQPQQLLIDRHSEESKGIDVSGKNRRITKSIDKIKEK